jgi:NADH:ubiquinone oxidoreductase subunit C
VLEKNKRSRIQKKVVFFLKKIVSGLIKNIWVAKYEIVIKINRSDVEPFIDLLSRHLLTQVKVLTDLVVYDRPGKNYRFVVIYSLLSVRYNLRFQVQTAVNEVLPLFSIVDIFSGAGWLEREAWDMFGIVFINNGDLRRILTDYGFVSHPLRKDFPLIGFKEIYYSDRYRRVVYVDLQVSQEGRNFRFKRP